MKNKAIMALRKAGQKYAYASLQMHESISKKAGFASTDHKYLGFLLQKGTLTAGELAELSGLTTGAVTSLIDRYEKKDLVKREFDSRDRRKVIIVPDKEKITNLFEPFYKEFQEKTERLISSYTVKEIEIIESYFSNAIALMSETHKKVIKSEVLDNGPFYHGTKADLQIGDLLTAGYNSNYKPEVIMNHIYFTASVNGAGLAAEIAPVAGFPRVYLVEPTGDFENDPNVTDKKFPGNPTRSYRSKKPLKIIGEVIDWVRLTDGQLQVWKENLAKIKADPKAEIIN